MIPEHLSTKYEDPVKEKKRLEIIEQIEWAQENGLYEVAEHITSSVDLGPTKRLIDPDVLAAALGAEEFDK